MARPCPVPATIGARGISNLVPGGYKIRPYDMGGEWCARRTAPDPGAGGPMWASAPTRRNHRTLAQSNGFRAAIKAAPTGKRKAWRRGGLHGRPCRTAASDAPPPTAPAVGARMARPCPVPATIGARGISNLVPGGYKIRPYDMGGEWCARRTAPDPGAGGPMWASAPTRRNHRTAAQTTGFQAAIQAAPACRKSLFATLRVFLNFLKSLKIRVD